MSPVERQHRGAASRGWQVTPLREHEASQPHKRKGKASQTSSSPGVQQPRRPAAQKTSGLADPRPTQSRLISPSHRRLRTHLRLVRIILQEILLLALTLLIPLAFRDICIRFVLRIRRREYDHFGRTESCAGLWLGRDTIASVILIVIAIRDDGGGGG
jgi:hypothetical protein